MTSPIDDTSRWTTMSSRYEVPTFLVNGLRQMIREAYGDEVADALEATIPPPFGTLGTDHAMEVRDSNA